MRRFEPNGGLALFQFQHWHTSEFCQITWNKEVGLGPVEFQMTTGHLSITNIKYKVISIKICTFSLNLWGVAQVQRYFHSNVSINNADAAICYEKTLHIINNDTDQLGTIMRVFNIIVIKMWHLGLNTIILIWIWSCENLRFGFIQVLVLSHTLLHQNLKRAARFANEWCSANVSHKIPHQRNGCHVISAICVRGPGNDSFKLNMWKRAIIS